MAPEFQKAAESLSPLIPFYNVDCDEQENKALCAAEDIKGFPTVKVSRSVNAALVNDSSPEHSLLRSTRRTRKVARVEEEYLSARGKLDRSLNGLQIRSPLPK